MKWGPSFCARPLGSEDGTAPRRPRTPHARRAARLGQRAPSRRVERRARGNAHPASRSSRRDGRLDPRRDDMTTGSKLVRTPHAPAGEPGRRRSQPPSVSERRQNASRSLVGLPAHLAAIQVERGREAQPFTREQAAGLLGIHPRTLDRWARLERIRVIDLGGTVRIRVDEVQRLLRAPRSRTA